VLLPIDNVVALVTGSNRGLGRALVDELLSRGVKKVYAASRSGSVPHEDPRVFPLALDVTRPDSLAEAARRAPDLNVLINNAGLLASYGVLSSTTEAIREDLETNFFGVLEATRAFLPALERNAPGVVANVLSVVSYASMPSIGGYSASKAAAWSLTQALRAELAPRNLRVTGIFPGAIDTDMIRSFPIPKTSPADVARAIVDGIEAGRDDVYPDPISAELGALWQTDPAAVERRLAG
jgi:NAD(P)-dependent dehydrogenase (short-subunit alcohol dehydrogenase family)